MEEPKKRPKMTDNLKLGLITIFLQKHDGIATAVERLTAEVQTQTDPPAEATHDWVTDGPPQPRGAQTLAV